MRRWRALSPTIRDTIAAGLLIAASFVPGIAERGLQVGELHLRGATGLSVVLLVIQALSLAPRRRWPAAGLAVGGVAWGLYQLGGYPPTVAGLAVLILLYSVGAHQERFRRAVAVAGTAGYVLLAIALHLRGSGEDLINYVTFFVVLAASWGAGAWVRSRQHEEARQRRASVLRAITDERGRIARELHDVVTHHVTAMVVQADMAGFLISADPEKAADGVAAVSGSGREALTELRRLLGVLDGAAPAEAQPERVADLVERMRRAGQPVDFAEEGGPGPGGGLGLAVHRVVQEALTNAVKHARGRPTRVRVRHAGDGTEIEVVTEGSFRGALVPGRGLTGLGERVKVFGGTFEASGTETGDFAVRVQLPLAVPA
ncbi:two-component sensor histidine kinase [Actinoplanes cyaneus]|uniref:histidine kinase n=1 Tax=Actinoplanes cyaneus TaxID=52696 RepID=A0A919IQK0_9ACTN|nr:histidine kinase [Actinoplanes cyaneus]MCW2140908.1 Signal transduction histidine kinase [Actinoplanes cyaneus]GID69161.1 two-component sensor histidine kinase [Actinoplanes cyaneus]